MVYSVAVMAKPIEYNATVVERVDLNPALAIFRIAADPGVAEGLRSFVPGQYAVLGLNNEARPELGSVKRPMSIVSAPEEGGPLEFYVRYVSHPESENPLTHLLWTVRTGDRIYLGPKIAGRFTLEHTVGAADTRIKICVAAGTGLAPFIAYVRSARLREPGRSLEDFVILHGASYPTDVGYQEELGALVRGARLGYFATISRPKEAPGWQGDSGRVEDYFKADRLLELEARLGLPAGHLTPKTAAVFICGLQGTIGETVVRMLARGFVPENRRLRKALEVPETVPSSLFFEQYDTTPVVDLENAELMASLRATLETASRQLSGA